MTPVSQFLHEGEAAFTAGNRSQAMALFAQAVRADPSSELGWWWLGLCVSEPQQQADCFRRVLAINPQHLEARRMLDRLSATSRSPSEATPIAPATANAHHTVPTPAVPQPDTPSPLGHERSSRPAQPIAMAAATTTTRQRRPWTKLGWVVAMLGVVFLLCAMLAGTLVLRRLGTAQPAAAVTSVGPTAQGDSTPASGLAFPTFPPTWTPAGALTGPTSAAPTSQPPGDTTATPQVTPSEPYEIRLQAAQADILEAQRLNDQSRWAEALPIWDAVIAQVPEYADAYYQRTRCYLHLNTEIRVFEQYRDNLELALRDMNQALTLDPTNGDYYYERHVVHFNLAQIQFYRADYDYWRELSLADAKRAIAYDTRRAFIERDVAYSLIDLRRYDEALEMFSQLPLAEGTSLETDPGLQVGLAESYLGLGQFEAALEHIDLAIAANPGTFKKFDRALILYSLGRLDEALAQLDESIEETAHTLGARYYLRALIHYRLDQPDLALEDVVAGSGETWERGGVRSYVLGLMAWEAGDQKQAIGLLLEAEASLHPMYSPVIMEQIQADLAQLNASTTNTPQP